jgi:hypothetical protein
MIRTKGHVQPLAHEIVFQTENIVKRLYSTMDYL